MPDCEQFGVRAGLLVTDMKLTLNENFKLTMGKAQQDDAKRVTSALGAGRRLPESGLPGMPGEQRIGENADMSFYLVRVGDSPTPASGLNYDKANRALLQPSPSASASVMPDPFTYNLTDPWSEYSIPPSNLLYPMQPMSIPPEPQAVALAVQTSSKTYCENGRGISNAKDLCVEVYLNGELVDVVAVPCRELGLSLAKNGDTLIISGTRIHRQVEKPWVYEKNTAQYSTNEARSRWQDVSAQLMQHANSKGHKNGVRPLTGTYLEHVASMDIPNAILNSSTRYSIVDIVIVAGIGAKYSSATPYLKAPTKLTDPQFRFAAGLPLQDHLLQGSLEDFPSPAKTDSPAKQDTPGQDSAHSPHKDDYLPAFEATESLLHLTSIDGTSAETAPWQIPSAQHDQQPEGGEDLVFDQVRHPSETVGFSGNWTDPRNDPATWLDRESAFEDAFQHRLDSSYHYSSASPGAETRQPPFDISANVAAENSVDPTIASHNGTALTERIDINPLPPSQQASSLSPTWDSQDASTLPDAQNAMPLTPSISTATEAGPTPAAALALGPIAAQVERQVHLVSTSSIGHDVQVQTPKTKKIKRQSTTTRPAKKSAGQTSTARLSKSRAYTPRRKAVDPISPIRPGSNRSAKRWNPEEPTVDEAVDKFRAPALTQNSALTYAGPGIKRQIGKIRGGEFVEEVFICGMRMIVE